MCWTRCVLIYDISDVRCPPSFHSMQHPRKTSIDASIGKFLNFHVHHMTSWRVNILIILCQLFTLFLQRCWAIETKHFLFQFLANGLQFCRQIPSKIWSFGPPALQDRLKSTKRTLARLPPTGNNLLPTPHISPKSKTDPLFYYQCLLLRPAQISTWPNWATCPARVLWFLYTTC